MVLTLWRTLSKRRPSLNLSKQCGEGGSHVFFFVCLDYSCLVNCVVKGHVADPYFCSDCFLDFCACLILA